MAVRVRIRWLLQRTGGAGGAWIFSSLPHLCCPLSAGTGDTVAVMITEAYGKDMLAHLDRNLTVLVSLVFRPTKNINRGSLVFVSISFIVLMIISSAWLIFYFIQKIRYSSSHDRSQVTVRRETVSQGTVRRVTVTWVTVRWVTVSQVTDG